MQDELFEWDDAKAASNWRDHGVTFEMAREVFKDPFALEWSNDSQGAQEPRYSIIRPDRKPSAVCRLHHAGRGHPHHIGPKGGALRATEISQ